MEAFQISNPSRHGNGGRYSRISPICRHAPQFLQETILQSGFQGMYSRMGDSIVTAPLQHDEKAGVCNLRVSLLLEEDSRYIAQVPYHATCSRQHLGRPCRSAGCLRSCDNHGCACASRLFSQRHVASWSQVVMNVESRFRVQLLCRHGPSSRSTLFLGEACFSHIWVARVLVLRQRLQLFRDAVFNQDQALKIHRSRLKLH